jgi:hypothetical protein
MLSKQTNSTMKTGASICSSKHDLEPMHCAIKDAFFELDKDLRKVVKDDSGCVCVSISSLRSFLFLFRRGNIRLTFLDHMSHWSGNDLFNQYRRFSCYYYFE